MAAPPARMTKRLSVNGSAAQSGQEVFAPALWQSGRGNGLLQEAAIIFLTDEKPVDLGDRDAVVIPGDEFQGVSLAHFALLLYCEIEPAASTEREALQHVIPFKFGCQLVTRNTRLTDHHDGRADSKAVPHTEFVFAKAF